MCSHCLGVHVTSPVLTHINNSTITSCKLYLWLAGCCGCADILSMLQWQSLSPLVSSHFISLSFVHPPSSSSSLPSLALSHLLFSEVIILFFMLFRPCLCCFCEFRVYVHACFFSQQQTASLRLRCSALGSHLITRFKLYWPRVKDIMETGNNTNAGGTAGAAGGDFSDFSVSGWQVPGGVCVWVRGRVSNIYHGRMGGLVVSSFVPRPLSQCLTQLPSSSFWALRAGNSKRPVCEFVQTPVSPTCQERCYRWYLSWLTVTRFQLDFSQSPPVTCIVNREPFVRQVVQVNDRDLISFIPWVLGRKHFVCF